MIQSCASANYGVLCVGGFRFQDERLPYRRVKLTTYMRRKQRRLAGILSFVGRRAQPVNSGG